MQNELTAFLGNDLNLKDLLEIINPQNNLVLADDVMLVDATALSAWSARTMSGTLAFPITPL